MATETLTVVLTSSDDKVKGKDLVSDENDTQIVTITDGGNLEGQSFTFEFWGKDTANNPGEGSGGNDVFMIDLSDFEENFEFTVKSMEATDTFMVRGSNSWTTVGSVHSFTYVGSDGGTYTFTIDAQSTNSGFGEATVVCFTDNARILTPRGEVPVGQLAAGDMVTCGDGRVRAIRWIGRRDIPPGLLAANPSLRPVTLAPDALGRGLPSRPLGLSQQHRVLVDDWRAQMFFGEDAVLVPAKSLVNDRAVRLDHDPAGLRYHHILLDGHHTVFANGLECETLMPAEIAHTALPPESRSEIYRIFPELVGDLASFGRHCHASLTVCDARILAAPARSSLSAAGRNPA